MRCQPRFGVDIDLNAFLVDATYDKRGAKPNDAEKIAGADVVDDVCWHGVPLRRKNATRV